MCVGNEKKKHLQFNDITAPSLARRAARRGAEKGESGRMEPGVINVFFFFPLARSSTEFFLFFSSPFRSPSLPAIFFHSFLIFVAMKLSIVLFWKTRRFHRYVWFSPISWTRNPRQPSCSSPLIPLCLVSSKCNRCFGTIKSLQRLSPDVGTSRQ